MYYSQKKNTFVRIYNDKGFITNVSKNDILFINYPGTELLKAVSRQPNTIENMVESILKNNPAFESTKLKKQCFQFMEKLVEDGYVVKSNSIKKLEVEMYKTSHIQFSPRLSIVSEGRSIFSDVFKETFPLVKFQVELTNNCNEKCIHCYLPSNIRGKTISKELFYSLLDQLKDLDVLELTLSGGEPFLHPNIKDFLSKLSEYDFYIGILSNLTLLDSEIINLLEKLSAVKIQTSLYSLNEETHESITKLKGSFVRTKENIEKLLNRSIKVKVACPIMKNNRFDFINVYRWCQKKGIEFSIDYSMSTDISHLKLNNEIRLYPQEAKDVIMTIINNNSNYQQAILRNNSIVTRHKQCDEEICKAGKYSLCMIHDGTIYPCAAWQSFPIDNLLQNNLKNIWNESVSLKRLRDLKIRDLANGDCSKCKNLDKCSICMAKNANESKSSNPLEKAKYFCDLTNALVDAEIEWMKLNNGS